ncbi:MAG: HAMP domain-containing histidine kinase [Nocardioidaceae bacterium]|nr:HAMP domain-containing histidine kinase [Nocardioidaceae bacterium]
MRDLIRRWVSFAPDLRSFRRQVILFAAVVSGVAALVLVLLVQLIMAGLSTRTADEMLATRTDAFVDSVRTASIGARIRVPPAVLDVGVAVYDGDGRLVAGRPPVRLAQTYREARPGVPRNAHAGHQPYRLLASTFTTPGGSHGTVVMTERLAPYEQTERYVLLLTLAAGVVLVAGATSVAAWASRQVLRPVSEMARTAEDWSEHHLSRRFDLGPPANEITALAATLDGLLEKVAHAIRTEQQLTGELAHELRTPLAVISGNAELLAQRTDLSEEAREDVREVRDACRRMAGTISSLLELARSGRVVDAEAGLAEVLDEVVAHLPAERRPAVSLPRPPTREHVRVPAELAVRVVYPLVENAVRFGGRVRLLVETTPAQCVVHVDDDGPGVDEAVRGHAFDPGLTTGTGSGLGLSLSRRIARSVGGDVVLGDPPRDWSTRFTVTLPRSRTAAGTVPDGPREGIPAGS